MYVTLTIKVWNWGEDLGWTVLITSPQMKDLNIELPFHVFFLFVTLPLIGGLIKFLPLSFKTMVYTIWRIHKSMSSKPSDASDGRRIPVEPRTGSERDRPMERR